MTDERAEIDCQRLFPHSFEKRFEVGRRTAAIPRNQRSDAHADKIFGRRIVVNILDVRVNVNKAGRDDFVLRVNDFLGFALINSSDPGNPSVFYPDCAAKPRIARAVNDARVDDGKIVNRLVKGSGLIDR